MQYFYRIYNITIKSFFPVLGEKLLEEQKSVDVEFLSETCFSCNESMSCQKYYLNEYHISIFLNKSIKIYNKNNHLNIESLNYIFHEIIKKILNTKYLILKGSSILTQKGATLLTGQNTKMITNLSKQFNAYDYYVCSEKFCVIDLDNNNIFTSMDIYTSNNLKIKSKYDSVPLESIVYISKDKEEFFDSIESSIVQLNILSGNIAHSTLENNKFINKNISEKLYKFIKKKKMQRLLLYWKTKKTIIKLDLR